MPGQVEEIRFDIPDVAHTFRRGHRIMVQIQSSWFPLIDRNPQTFVQIRSAKPEDFDKDLPSGKLLVHLPLNEKETNQITTAAGTVKSIQLAADPETPDFAFLFIQALQAIVSGSRDRSLADNPALYYTMAAEVLYLIEQLEQPA